MIVRNNLIVVSSLGKTDCRRSNIYCQDNKIFAQNIRVPGELRTPRFVALPILIARLASPEATHEASARIVEAQEQQIFLWM